MGKQHWTITGRRRPFLSHMSHMSSRQPSHRQHVVKKGYTTASATTTTLTWSQNDLFFFLFDYIIELSCLRCCIPTTINQTSKYIVFFFLISTYHLPTPSFRNSWPLQQRHLQYQVFKSLLHTLVKVEKPHKRCGIPQCLNCQFYGHTRAYCTYHARCVKCGEGHPTIQHAKKRLTLLAPANCAIAIIQPTTKAALSIKSSKTSAFSLLPQPIPTRTMGRCKNFQH